MTAFLIESIAMKNKLPAAELNGRIERELEREHYQRTLNDEARTGLGADDEYRSKDARESTASTNLKRSH
jgi:hypothetical protein